MSEAPRGRLGPRLALVTLAIGLAAANTGNNLLYLILSLVLGLGLASLAAARAGRRMTIVPHLPEMAVAGQPFVVAASVSGRFPLLPQTWVQVRLEGLPRPVEMEVAIPARDGRAVASATLPAPGRGFYRALRVVGLTGYPLDLATTASRPVEAGPLVVTPAFTPLRSLRVLGRAAAAIEAMPAASPRPGGSGGETIDRRPFLPHDDARHIDWRASARSGETIVREYEREAPRRIDLVLDREASDPARFEAAVARAAAILDLAAREGFDARLCAEGLEAPLAGREALVWLAGVTPVAARGTGAAGASLAGLRAGAETIVLSADPARETPLEMA